MPLTVLVDREDRIGISHAGDLTGGVQKVVFF
jgi:hypothetical protein